MPDKRVILGVFAHPDDETSGCGGTFTRYAREGVEVFNVTATRGSWARWGRADSASSGRSFPTSVSGSCAARWSATAPTRRSSSATATRR